MDNKTRLSFSFFSFFLFFLFVWKQIGGCQVSILPRDFVAFNGIASTTQKQRAKSPWEGIASRGPCPLSLSNEGYFLELAIRVFSKLALPSRTQDGDVVPHVFQTLGPVHGCKTKISLNNNSKLAPSFLFFSFSKIIFQSQYFLFYFFTSQQKSQSQVQVLSLIKTVQRGGRGRATCGVSPSQKFIFNSLAINSKTRQCSSQGK